MAKEKSILNSILSNVQGNIQSKHIVEWSDDDNDFIVYWTPITLADKQKIQKHSRGDDQATTVYTLIFKAIDKDGNKLFDLSDKVTLMQSIPSKTIEEIALLILDVGDVLGN